MQLKEEIIKNYKKYFALNISYSFAYYMRSVHFYILRFPMNV